MFRTTSKVNNNDLNKSIFFEGNVEEYFYRSRKKVLFTLLSITFVVMIFFGINAYHLHVFDITYINIFQTILSLLLIILLKKNFNIDIIAYIYFSSLGSYFLYFMIYGGIRESGYVWTFLFPLATLFFFGRKTGLWFSLTYLFFSIIILFTISIYLKYGMQFHFRYISLYVAIVIISYSFGKAKDDLTKAIAKKNKTLQIRLNELKEKDKDLRRAKERAEQADRLKSEFLAQMSHEIRTPVNTILNYTSLIESECRENLPEDMNYSFKAIQKSSGRLIRTIDLILDLSSIEAGSYEPYFEKILISKDIIQPLIDEFEPSAKSKGLYLLFLKGENSTEPFISADRYTLSQATANLIDNAIKYTNTGGVKVHLKCKKNSLKLLIEDTGIGISSDYLPKLFEKFSQETEGYSRKYEGTGLGMALVKRYCEINNTHISVDSLKNKGTTFTISIPLKQTNQNPTHT